MTDKPENPHIGKSSHQDASIAGSLVLLSGGIDSSTALMLLHTPDPCSALFIDYGQAPAKGELHAAEAISARYGVTLDKAVVGPARFGSGEIRGRNALFLHLALMRFPYTSGSIVMGIHAGTAYRDCSIEFVRLMQRSLEFHVDGAIGISAPFIDLNKAAVVAIARDGDVPLDLTFSCESGDHPCGDCLSCLDRRALGVGP
jgi:7-cyano-7-deazaguanine synthase